MRQYNTLLNVKPFAMKTITYSTPFKASINGYCMEILAPHCRHLPRSIMYENTGTISRQPSLRPQLMQCEDCTIFSFFGMRKMQTFKKLPITIP